VAATQGAKTGAEGGRRRPRSDAGQCSVAARSRVQLLTRWPTAVWSECIFPLLCFCFLLIAIPETMTDALALGQAVPASSGSVPTAAEQPVDVSSLVERFHHPPAVTPTAFL
jgi:hypothetical protein